MRSKMPEKEIRVPKSARTPETEYKGLPVREAYYTAGYEEGSDVQNIAPMNHANTYVVRGESLEIPQDILLRTGNGLIKIQPEARSISSESDDESFRIFQTDDLEPEAERALIAKLGLLEEYDLLSKFGPGLHYRRMQVLREELERHIGEQNST